VQPGSNSLDPVVTWGLRILPWVAIGTLAAAFIAPLRLEYGWPNWVWTVSNGATMVGVVLFFALACVVGFRIGREEYELNGHDRFT
jgi:hypothetical protein